MTALSPWFAFKETFRVLIAYFDFQEKFDTSKFKKYESLKQEYDKLCAKLGNDYVEDIKSNLNAGAYELSKEELLQGTEFNFQHFINSRHSIRMYEKRSVTTDRACFSYVEQFQWYINGGIYLSYLSLALHSLGIGHCIMQWKAFYRTENELKKICGISKREAIIAVIGCGYYADNVKCIRAQRKTVDDTLHII